jgi:hypothetical protein
MRLSVMPSLKYSALESELAFMKGRTATDWIASRGRKKNHAARANNPKLMIAKANPIRGLARPQLGK